MSTSDRNEVKLATTPKGGRRANPAFSKPVKPDAQLAAVVGTDELPRPEVVRKLWSYIKAEGLQDQQDRRIIIADEKLRAIFDGRDRVNMFEMSKLVSKHLH